MLPPSLIAFFRSVMFLVRLGHIYSWYIFASTPIARRLELGTKCLDMVVDERSLVCGLEDGRVDVYSRWRRWCWWGSFSETILCLRSSHQRTALLSGHAERVTCLHMDTRLLLFLLLLFILITLWGSTASNNGYLVFVVFAKKLFFSPHTKCSGKYW